MPGTIPCLVEEVKRLARSHGHGRQGFSSVDAVLEPSSSQALV